MAEKNRQAALRRGKPRMGATESEYARHRGISQPAVNIAKHAGKLVLFPDGTINVAESDEKFLQQTDLEQSERGKMLAGPRGGAGTSQYLKMKTLQHAVATQIAREKLARMRGEVVDRGEAQRIVFALARAERNSWMAWPVRVAARLAADLTPPGGTPLDIHTVQHTLERYVREHLSSLMEPEEEIFPFAPEEEEDERFMEEEEGL